MRVGRADKAASVLVAQTRRQASSEMKIFMRKQMYKNVVQMLKNAGFTLSTELGSVSGAKMQPTKKYRLQFMPR